MEIVKPTHTSLFDRNMNSVISFKKISVEMSFFRSAVPPLEKVAVQGKKEITFCVVSINVSHLSVEKMRK